MTPHLYALKEDLDMIIQDIKNLKKGYGALDHIVKIIDELRVEQLFQSEQMKRIEERMDRIEERLDKIEKVLGLICQKFQIDPNV